LQSTLTLIYNWGAPDSIAVSSTTEDEQWEEIKNRIKNDFMFACRKAANKNMQT